jgi:hypothetical protein
MRGHCPFCKFKCVCPESKGKTEDSQIFFHLLIKKQTATAAKKLNKIADSLKRPFVSTWSGFACRSTTITLGQEVALVQNL